jgi:hypothetical protein
VSQNIEDDEGFPIFPPNGYIKHQNNLNELTKISLLGLFPPRKV